MTARSRRLQKAGLANSLMGLVSLEIKQPILDRNATQIRPAHAHVAGANICLHIALCNSISSFFRQAHPNATTGHGYDTLRRLAHNCTWHAEMAMHRRCIGTRGLALIV